MKSHAELFEEFADLGFRPYFCLKNGEYYAGYILEIGEESFEFGIGGALAPKDPITIEYSSVDLKSLGFYGMNEKCHKNAVWSEEADEWIITNYHDRNTTNSQIQSSNRKSPQSIIEKIIAFLRVF